VSFISAFLHFDVMLFYDSPLLTSAMLNMLNHILGCL